MTIDEFLDLAQKRRSIRRFKPDPVPDELINKILEVGRWAMSGANGQPWEYIVVKDKEVIKKMYEAGNEVEKALAAMEGSRVPDMRQPWYRDLPRYVPRSRIPEGAQVLIVVCADPRTSQATVLLRLTDRRWVIDENIANTTQLLNLAAAACGLGSQWVTVDYLYEQMLKPILGVPPIMRIMNIVPIGYPAYKPSVPYRRKLEEIVHHDRYDMSKYRSPEEVQEFIRKLRVASKPVYPLK